MKRRQEREYVFQLLFETEFHREVPPSGVYMNSLLYTPETESAYVRDTYFGTVEHGAETDAKIADASKKWKLSRMSVVTRSILRLATYEMIWGEIPPKAAINEAIELAKIYDDDAAPAFINGILNRIARSEGLIADNGTSEAETEKEAEA